MRALYIKPNGNYKLKYKDGWLELEFSEEPTVEFHTDKEGYAIQYDRVFEAAHPTRGYEPGDSRS